MKRGRDPAEEDLESEAGGRSCSAQKRRFGERGHRRLVFATLQQLRQLRGPPVERRKIVELDNQRLNHAAAAREHARRVARGAEGFECAFE